MKTIQKDSLVTFHYQLHDEKGGLIESSDQGEPVRYTHGYGEMIEGVEIALDGKNVGDKFEVKVPPELGYGESFDDLLQQVPMEAFEGVDNLHIGMRFNAASEDGSENSVSVVAIDADTVTIDANHPFAGKTLVFDIEVIGVE
jgi:FKBP-type peptidyl-prolyl cis-trans isomerase SlyD